LSKKCFIIAGPNGAGKTTFAMELLVDEIPCQYFINADLIAKGLSPFAPELAAIHAGKLMLSEIDKCVSNGNSFAIETTLSGLSYQRKISDWKLKGYEIILYYFTLPSVDMAIERVKLRVSEGGHNIPENDIRRRFSRSFENFEQVYKYLCDFWVIFDTSDSTPKVIRSSE